MHKKSGRWLVAALIAVAGPACATPAEKADEGETAGPGAVRVVEEGLTQAPSTGQVAPGTLFDLAAQANAGRTAPSTYVEFPKPRITEWIGRERDRILVKFVEGSHVRLRNTGLEVDLGGATAAVQTAEVNRLSRGGFTRASSQVALTGIRQIIAGVPGVKIAPAFSQTEADLDARKASGEANTGIELADMNLAYELRVAEADAPALLDALNASDLVEIAYPAMIASDAAQDLAPTTSSYVASQTYLERAPGTALEWGGLDARFGWTRTGGNGANVRVFDVENAWNLGHEDLGAGGNNGPSVSLRFNGCEDAAASSTCPAGAPCHGTAALGILHASPNAYGVTGIAYGATYGIAGTYPNSSCTGYSVADAINAAAGSPNTQNGDVILLERGLYSAWATCPTNGSSPCGNCNNPKYGQVPAEYGTFEFMAIQNATANGRIVVEPAGNGEQNLDDPRYNNWFNRTTHDSGAIVVGAGSGSSSRAPMCFSDFGSRLDVQGHGFGVTTLGYSDVSVNGSDQNQWYTNQFNATSSASAIVAGVATAVQGACKAGGIQGACLGGGLIPPKQNGLNPGMRELLAIASTPQDTPVTQRIGPLPNTRWLTAQYEPPARGALAAAPWTSTKDAVFAVDFNGTLELRSKSGANPWTDPAAVPGGTTRFPAGAPVATGLPVPTELRVFSVSTAGQLYYSRSTSGGAFSTMATIGSTNAAPPGAILATGVRGTNQMHVFYVDASGTLKAFYATGTSTSFSSVTIASNFAPAGAPLATGRYAGTQLDVFAIGNNGALKAAYAADGDVWNVVDLSDVNVAQPWSPTQRMGGGVATGTQGTDQLDAFFVGSDNFIQAMWASPSSTFDMWLGPVDLQTGATFPSGSAVSTAKHGSGSNTLDVFAISYGGALEYVRVVGTGAWSSPTAVSWPTSHSVNSAFTATAMRGTDKLDLIAIGSNGISVATSTNGGSYNTFSKIP